MARMKGGQAVVESLKANGVDHVFGITAGHNMDIVDALYRNQDSIRYVTVRREVAAGHMADGYARASGKPGVCLTTSGAGAADTVASIGEAYFAGSPVLEITDNVELDHVDSGQGMCHQPQDQTGMFGSITEWSALVKEVEAIPDYVNEAFQRFKTKRPRPVLLDFPDDILNNQADVEVVPPMDVTVPQGDPALVERVVEALVNAKRPVIWVGEEILQGGGTKEVIKLAETLGAPVVTADGGKGAFPYDHPLSLGQTLSKVVWGTNRVGDFTGTCDVGLVLGSNLAYGTNRTTDVKMPETLIHVLLDKELIGKNYLTAMAIEANSKAVLGQILDQIDGQDIHKGDGYQHEIAELKREVYEELKRQQPNELYTLEAIRSVLPRNAITCWDLTVATFKAGRGFPVYEPRTYMYPHGWMGLGFGYPAALGAKLANPDSPVVCLTGDGGFQFNMQELGTAAQHDIPTTVVIFNDNAWGILKERQKGIGTDLESYGGRVYGTELTNPDFVKIFEAYGFKGTRVHTADELANALGAAIGSNRTQLIEAYTPDGFANFK